MIDKDIIQLRKKLKEKKYFELAELLKDSKLKKEPIIDETLETVTGHFYIIQLPKENFFKIKQKSAAEDIIFSTLSTIPELSEIFNPQGVFFERMKEEEERELIENKKLANSWIERAKNKLEEGKTNFQHWKYAEAISSFQECIEFSLKSLWLILFHRHPKQHKFEEKEYKEILNFVSGFFNDPEFPKLYLYSKFWGHFYTVAKYGLENFGIGAEKLFNKEEAILAQNHAEKCYFHVFQLMNFLENPW